MCIGISWGIVQFLKRWGTMAVQTLGRALVRASQTARPIVSGGRPLVASSADNTHPNLYRV